MKIAGEKVEDIYETSKPICACCVAVWAVTIILLGCERDCCIENHKCAVSSTSQSQTEREAPLSFLFLSWLLFLMRHVGQSSNSQGHHTLLTNLFVPAFLASTHGQPSQSGTASPSAGCQMLWPGFQTICLPARRRCDECCRVPGWPTGNKSSAAFRLNSSPLSFGSHRYKSGLIHPDFVRYWTNWVK